MIMNKQNTTQKQLVALDLDNSKEYEFLIGDNDTYTIEDKELNAHLEETPDGFTFMNVNGVSYPVEIVAQKQNEYEILINGISYCFSVETPFSLQRRKILSSQANESSTILLKAPMPGKILDVLVKTGDTVKAGDTLVILEAMKMQNAILASTKAIVKKVVVKVGDTTSKSDLLIELEKDN
ncbi:biotin/lipoyl-binding protein [Dysgonomonas sp. GY617]|nr:biotin/lipoyl-binding protein [Dysgonomonas sp. GY617]